MPAFKKYKNSFEILQTINGLYTIFYKTILAAPRKRKWYQIRLNIIVNEILREDQLSFFSPNILKK